LDRASSEQRQLEVRIRQISESGGPSEMNKESVTSWSESVGPRGSHSNSFLGHMQNYEQFNDYQK